MRISDWSSDVCSSDLLPCAPCRSGIQHVQGICAHDAVGLDAVIGLKPPDCLCHLQSVTIRRDVLIRSQITLATEPFSDTRHAKIHITLLDQSSGRDGFECFMGCLALVLQIRLEEHTYELQYLMRISYADFYLKKTK